MWTGGEGGVDPVGFGEVDPVGLGRGDGSAGMFSYSD